MKMDEKLRGYAVVLSLLVILVITAALFGFITGEKVFIFVAGLGAAAIEGLTLFAINKEWIV